MQRKLFSAVGVLAATLLAVSCVSYSQAAQSAAAPDGSLQITEVLQQGSQLETDRRWGEALSLYEEAVRKFPRDPAIRAHFNLARMHYDLGRRYSDRSFRQLVDRLSPEETLDVYGEVLLKLQAHYVEVPNWKGIVERGTTGFEVALSEPTFVSTYLAGVDARTIQTFRSQLRSRLATLDIRTQTGARAAVGMAASMAADQLGIAPSAVVLEYLCGATNSLDLYSAYLTPDQLRDIYSQIEGNFVGLGIELKAADGALLIVRVIGGSPAEKAGILAGDRILSVDGQSTRPLSTEQAADLLQGTVGSVAQLLVETPGKSPRQLSVQRNHIDVPSVDDVKIIDPAQGIGYLKLTCFQKTTARDLDAALWSLHRQGMRSLIMDLCGNPGGLLVTSVEVADKFLDRGVIVSTHGRTTGEDFTYSAHSEGTWRVPLVVMIDKDSASAAEIFAGAIHDHRRGTIVGERSFGKGSVQGIFPLNVTDAGVRLTTAKFYSPTGQPYAGIGVEPNLTVTRTARPILDPNGVVSRRASTENPILSAAIQAARQQLVAQR